MKTRLLYAFKALNFIYNATNLRVSTTRLWFCKSKEYALLDYGSEFPDDSYTHFYWKSFKIQNSNWSNHDRLLALENHISILKQYSIEPKEDSYTFSLSNQQCNSENFIYNATDLIRSIPRKDLPIKIHLQRKSSSISMCNHFPLHFFLWFLSLKSQ